MWDTIPLGELTENFDSTRVPVKQRDRKPGPYPYYGASGVVDYVHDFLFEGEHLLIAEDGENLRTRNTPIAFLADGKFWVNNHAHIVKGNGRVTTKFLAYALAVTDVSGFLTGSTMPKLTQNNMNRIPIVAPPREVQDRITQVLGALDDKIELNRRMNATLESLARAIFKSWFVDFDPVRMKSKGRMVKSENPNSNISPFTLHNSLFPSSFQDSDLGKIPTGWKVKRLGDVIDINERSIKKGQVEGEIQYIDIASVAVGKCDGARVMEFADAPSRARRKSEHGDTIWSCVRPNRRSFYYVDSPVENLLVSTGFAVLSPRELTSSFLYQYVTTQEFTDYLTVNADGSAYPAVRADHFADADVLVPPPEVLQQFEELTIPARERIAHNERESLTLSALRDTLLPKLLSGELPVPAALTAESQID